MDFLLTSTLRGPAGRSRKSTHGWAISACLFVAMVTMATSLLAAPLPAPAAKKAKTPAALPPPPAPVFTGPRYFFNIDLDSRYQIVGRGALTEEAAKVSDCYRFIANSAGKMQQIEYRKAGVPQKDPFLGVVRIDYEYQPGVERRWFRNRAGDPMKNCYDIEGEELTVNTNGYPTDVTNLDASGARMRDSLGVIHYTRILDNFNRVVNGQRIGLLGTPITDNNGYFETRTQYDNESRKTSYDNFDANGAALNNVDGVASFRTSYTIFPEQIQISRGAFDANGLAVLEKNTGAHTIRILRDNRGFKLSEAYFDITGAPCLDIKSEVHERRYTYDEQGNTTSEAFYNTDDSLMEEKNRGYARVTYKYDDLNRCIETAFFGDDDMPSIIPSLGAAILRVEYDANGDVCHQQYFDGLGQPTPCTKYGVPAIRIWKQGDRTVISLRDGSDNVMKAPVTGFATVTYKTNAQGDPLLLSYLYYDRFGYPMSYIPRISVINPHLYAMREEARQLALAHSSVIPMQLNARVGAGAAGFGALLGFILAWRKSSYARRRKIYIPTPQERLLGWISSFAIVEGTLRFVLTVYWWWLDHQNASMGRTIYVIEGIIIVFFLYRLYRMRLTMRVLNIEKDHIHRLVRAFYAKANLRPDWMEPRNSYMSGPLDVRIRYFRQKFHAYLGFRQRGREGRDLARALAQYLRAQVRGVLAPERSRMIAFYYPIISVCYVLYSCTAFYTLYQLVKRY